MIETNRLSLFPRKTILTSSESQQNLLLPHDPGTEPPLKRRRIQQTLLPQPMDSKQLETSFEKPLF